MEILTLTSELMEYFKSRPEMLIFEGACSYYPKVTALKEGESYALVVEEDDRYKLCFATEDMDFVDKVLSDLHGKIALSGVDSFIIENLNKRYDLEWETDCMLYVWNGLPLPHINIYETQPMSAKYAQRVSDGTYYHAEISDITECLERYPSSAIYVDGEPVCWCLCHLDKSLGMLFTLPEYRRKGYALEVMTSLCNATIARGDIPFAYIVTSNEASMRLAEKYNLTPVKRADYCGFVKK